MSDQEEEALKVIQSHRQGVLQSELWKLLDIDSRKCSRIVKRLLDAGLIERIEFRSDGIKTYLLRAKKRAIDPPASSLREVRFFPASAAIGSAPPRKSARSFSTGCTNLLLKSIRNKAAHFPS